jgi:hypothetical protein
LVPYPPPGRSPNYFHDQPRPQQNLDGLKAVMCPRDPNRIIPNTPAPNPPTVRIQEAVVEDWQRDLGTIVSHLEAVIKAAMDNETEDRAKRARKIAEELWEAIGERRRRRPWN